MENFRVLVSSEKKNEEEKLLILYFLAKAWLNLVSDLPRAVVSATSDHFVVAVQNVLKWTAFFVLKFVSQGPTSKRHQNPLLVSKRRKEVKGYRER